MWIIVAKCIFSFRKATAAVCYFFEIYW